MATLLVVLDEKNREWVEAPKMEGVHRVKLDLDNLELTTQEIEQHTSALVKMLLQCVREDHEQPQKE